MHRTHALGLLMATPVTFVAARAAAYEPPESYRPEDPLQAATLEDALTLERGESQARAWLSLGSFYRRNLTGRTELGLMLMLGVPLERIAAPGPARLPSPTAVADTPAPAPTPPPEAPRPAAIRVNAKVARACVQAAWRSQGWSDERDLDRMASRSRWSSVLPEVRLRVARGWDESFRLTPTDADPYRSQQVTGASRWLEGRLIWRLDRALFSDHEIPIERLRLQRAEARSKLAGRVLAALFDWQKAAIAASDPLLTVQEHLQAVLQEAEAEAVLDVLTAGWFSAWLQSSGGD